MFYVSVVWSSTAKTNLNKLQTIQNEIMPMAINSNPRYSNNKNEGNASQKNLYRNLRTDKEVPLRTNKISLYDGRCGQIDKRNGTVQC